MAVPISGIKRSDVISELGLSSGSSLLDCFSAANDNGFDPVYEGAKDSLLDFRNYSSTSGNLTQFLIDSSTKSASPNAACLATGLGDFYMYHDGSLSFPVVGDRIYLENNTSGLFLAGANSYYQAFDGAIKKTLRVDNNGYVTAVSTCF